MRANSSSTRAVPTPTTTPAIDDHGSLVRADGEERACHEEDHPGDGVVDVQPAVGDVVLERTSPGADQAHDDGASRGR